VEDMRRWEDNIRMDLRETGWKDVDWMHTAWDRANGGGGSCEHGNDPSGPTKGGGFLD
jgi:hypothetical protein